PPDATHCLTQPNNPMDLEALRIFIKVAELASFTRAGEQLGLTKSSVSSRLGALEAELASRLLQRTTRAVKLTPDGEQFLDRARRLVQDADELAGMFQAPSAFRGEVRIDMPVSFAREHVIPRLPEFLAAHPLVHVLLSTTDQRVDLIREGIDCLLRIGTLSDSRLVARRLGTLAMVNVASPAYLRKYGTPRAVEDLDRHFIVHFSTKFGGETPAFEYPAANGYRERPVRSLVTVNNTDAYRAACLAGLGIIQVPRKGVRPSLASGALVEVLPELTCEPMPVSLLHGHARNVPKRVRAMMNWLTEVLSPHLH
ncbi:MAG TPA: LysR family transcriptional regulator, partial [Polyangiaceae bacterium]